LDGHEDDIFSCAFNYSGDTIITGSKDNTCRIWRDEAMMKEKAGAQKDVLDSSAGVTASGAATQKQD